MYLIPFFTQKPMRANGFGSTPWLKEPAEPPEKVPFSPTHSVNNLHQSTKTNTHSNVQETLKNNKACGNKSDNNNVLSTQNNQQHKQTAPCGNGLETKAVNNQVNRGELHTSQQGQGHVTSNTQHTHLEPGNATKRGKIAARFPTSEGLKKTKRRGTVHSSDLAHTEWGLDDHASPGYDLEHRTRGHRGMESYHASRSKEIQMNDVLQRLQKLEEFQHAHVMEAIKVKVHVFVVFMVAWLL